MHVILRTTAGAAKSLAIASALSFFIYL